MCMDMYIGTDIDWLLLHNQTRLDTKGYMLLDNFKQYNLNRPELICGDNAHPIWGKNNPDNPNDPIITLIMKQSIRYITM